MSYLTFSFCFSLVVAVVVVVLIVVVSIGLCTVEDTDESSGAEDKQGFSADTVINSSVSAAVSLLDAAAGEHLWLLPHLLPLHLQQPITVQQHAAAAGSEPQDTQRPQLTHTWKQSECYNGI